ncbi:hypothetical protein [Pseudomonas asiatica]|nr:MULTISPECIES: hypothetical protein [Pseudomonas]CAB5644076.1 Uncharacterised protein [Pseudomonas putida]PJI70997.1 hypothetical protein CSW00_26055 [Pseudomonas sp. MR 02]CAB5690586.1 Uncharacterised protein [Pseudomonas putida]CAB5717705.1 Uncharacterised protein [Pseudomonas putida]CAB5722753.1 Uncharacterised protein [Pseudomonas putida]
MTFDRQKHTTIANQFKAGRSALDIASDYGVTRERIYQILRRQGITGKHGGQAVRTSLRRSAVAAERANRHLEVYGCTIEQLDAVRAMRNERGGHPLKAFIYQRNHARYRGIPWHLKFWDWWQIWESSGKWAQRGREQGSYCMCRQGDVGPYAKDNVYIATVNHNTSLGRTLACERAGAPSQFMRFMRAAGGRKTVSETLGVSRAYLSQLANDGFMPAAWIDDGKALALVQMTAGAYSMDDARRMTAKPSHQKTGEAA